MLDELILLSHLEQSQIVGGEITITNGAQPPVTTYFPDDGQPEAFSQAPAAGGSAGWSFAPNMPGD